jgi:hypothetical protein
MLSQESSNSFKLYFVILILNTTVIGIISTQAANSNNNISYITEFSENILLSTRDSDYFHHVEPTLAISQNDTIFAGWKNAYGHNTGGVRVSFSKSIDYGISWTEPFDMPMYEGIFTGQSDPWLVWDVSGLYYAYLEYSIENDELSQITVAKSSDYGTSWVFQTQATYGNGFADKETMTISDNGVIYIAYDDITNYTTVRVSRSTDNGFSFNEVGVIADAITQPVDHLAPYIITDNNNDVYIAWIWFPKNETWGDVYITSSTDQGESFSTPIDVNAVSENCSFEITPDQRPSRVSLPVIRFDQNSRLYVLWAEKYEPNGKWDVYLRYSDNYGGSWSTRYQVNPDLSGNQWQPDMDIDSQNRLHIVWYDEQEGFFKPYYRIVAFSNNSDGQKEIIWGEPIAIANEDTSDSFTRPGDYFTIRVDSTNTPHVVWTDGRAENELDIFYAHGIVKKSSTTISFSNLWIIIPMVTIMMSIRKRLRKNK